MRVDQGVLPHLVVYGILVGLDIRVRGSEFLWGVFHD